MQETKDYSNISWKNFTLKEYLETFPIIGWEDFFNRSDIKEKIGYISNYLEIESRTHTIYPAIEDVFRAFIKPNLIKVIILGQDPYHNGSATGLCFSVKRGAKINQSLRNIYKELESEGITPKKDGDLTHWRTQGCFLLNTALTVGKGEASSHLHIWREITEEVIKYLKSDPRDRIWLLFGRSAHLLAGEPKEGDTYLVTSHPSPYSAGKPYRNFPSFLGSRVFRDVNNILKGREKEIIW